jgi:probable rRNA maturation factor
MALRVAVNRQAGAEAVPDPRVRGVVARAVRSTLRAQGCRDAELSVTLVDDAAIRELNRRWLGRSTVTDVIAFALHEGDAPPLGDVYVDGPQAARQAREQGVPLEEELVRLAVHGTLHVLGHDHPAGAARVSSPMWRLQEEIVRQVLKR